MSPETPRTPEEELNQRKFEYLQLRLEVENVAAYGDMEKFDAVMESFWRYFNLDPVEEKLKLVRKLKGGSRHD